jgi:hypothetical protein
MKKIFFSKSALLELTKYQVEELLTDYFKDPSKYDKRLKKSLMAIASQLGLQVKDYKPLKGARRLKKHSAPLSASKAVVSDNKTAFLISSTASKSVVKKSLAVLETIREKGLKSGDSLTRDEIAEILLAKGLIQPEGKIDTPTGDVGRVLETAGIGSRDYPFKVFTIL